MTGVELGYLISILSLIVASIVGFTNLRRNNSADDKKQSAEMTTVIVKLENINTGINEIKADVRNVKSEVQDYGYYNPQQELRKGEKVLQGR